MATKNTLFGTSGIRGSAETLFTKQFCFDIGRTFVLFLKRNKLLGPIAVGMDPRSSSPRIKEDVFRGLATSGEDLFDEGVTPIPSMNWLLVSSPVRAGIMVTGSHIAPELNGLKFYAHDEEVSLSDMEQIEEIYADLKGKEKPGSKEPNVILEDRAKRSYQEMLLGLVSGTYPKWKVALDCADGAQSVVIPGLLEELGLTVVPVNCNPQDRFIARDTDTDDKAELEELKKAVVTEGCALGVAFDGDGDRVVFVNENGEFVQGEYTCGLIAKNAPGDTIVTPVSSSQVVEKLGKKVVRTEVGSPFVIGKMKELNVKFGFEANGGAVSAEIMYTRDGGSMMIKILNAFARQKGSFSEMVLALPRFYMKRTKVDYKWEMKDEILAKAKEKFGGVRVDETDGLKLWIDETTWMLFRSSKNAPEFRVFAESEDEKKSEKLMAEGVAFVKEIIEK